DFVGGDIPGDLGIARDEQAIEPALDHLTGTQRVFKPPDTGAIGEVKALREGGNAHNARNFCCSGDNVATAVRAEKQQLPGLERRAHQADAMSDQPGGEPGRYFGTGPISPRWARSYRFNSAFLRSLHCATVHIY